jgi:hypothetical protein
MHRSRARGMASCFIVCGLAQGLASCGGSTDQAALASSTDAGNGADDNGSINAEFRLPSGTASQASYSLTGPNGFRQSDTLNFDGSQAIGFLIDNVPAGSGYTLTFTADSGTGEMCSGSAAVDVAAQMTAPVDVTAQCTGAPPPPAGFGSLEVWASLPQNVTFSGANFVLMGPTGVEAMNSVVVDGASLHFTLQAVPAGAGQTLTLNAMTRDGSKTCTATSEFTVVANQTTETMLAPVCH